jgi:pimeloyl-ACP methyl ester carboxylesterase
VDITEIESWDVRYANEQLRRLPNGVELYVDMYGSGGVPITIVTNFFVAGVAWRNFTPTLAKEHTIVTYDLRNQGASSRGGGATEEHARDLGFLLDDLGLESTYILASSMSTGICRDFAVENPDRVRGLLLCGPTVNPTGNLRRKYLIRSWIKILDELGLSALFDMFYPLVFSDGAVEQGSTAAYLALRERFLVANSVSDLGENMAGVRDAKDPAEKLRALTCPVLLFTGDSDYITTANALNEAAALIPDAAVELVPNCGHNPYVEAPDRFEELIEQYINRWEAT